MKPKLNSIIKSYAEVYRALEKLQNSGILPIGDQKTGVIAEYYAMCYVKYKFGKEGQYAKPGERFDLSFINGLNTIKIQVKAVSAHSKTRIIAPLNLDLVSGNAPFDYLYLISLDVNFKPDGFYINTYREIKSRLNQAKDKRTKIQGATMKGKTKQGYWLFDFTQNQADVILEAINCS